MPRKRQILVANCMYAGGMVRQTIPANVQFLKVSQCLGCCIYCMFETAIPRQPRKTERAEYFVCSQSSLYSITCHARVVACHVPNLLESAQHLKIDRVSFTSFLVHEPPLALERPPCYLPLCLQHLGHSEKYRFCVPDKHFFCRYTYARARCHDPQSVS